MRFGDVIDDTRIEPHCDLWKDRLGRLAVHEQRTENELASAVVALSRRKEQPMEEAHLEDLATNEGMPLPQGDGDPGTTDVPEQGDPGDEDPATTN
jgi:hypothetical protein